MECVTCKASDKDQRLDKCPICFKWTCDDCAHRAITAGSSARKKCADTFFFGDDDDER